MLDQFGLAPHPFRFWMITKTGISPDSLTFMPVSLTSDERATKLAWLCRQNKIFEMAPRPPQPIGGTPNALIARSHMLLQYTIHPPINANRDPVIEYRLCVKDELAFRRPFLPKPLFLMLSYLKRLSFHNVPFGSKHCCGTRRGLFCKSVFDNVLCRKQT